MSTETLLLEDFISVDILNMIVGDIIPYGVVGGFIITTIFTFISFGIFKAFTLFKDF